jgi:hypothetical protein
MQTIPNDWEFALQGSRGSIGRIDPQRAMTAMWEEKGNSAMGIMEKGVAPVRNGLNQGARQRMA